MTTVFLLMVLVLVQSALVTRMTEKRARILAGIAGGILVALYAIYILPMRTFDFFPESAANKVMSIALGLLVGGLIAWRINPGYFRWTKAEAD